MKTECFMRGNTPVVLYGEPADTLWLFIHGQFGCKEEALPFAEIVCPNAQVLSIDLPGHGTRRDRGEAFAPWTAAPELAQVMAYARAHWCTVKVRATSIGAYFAQLAFAAPEKALFVSPVADMERLICDRIRAAGITEDKLRVLGEYPAEEGDMLSWDYLCWVRMHPVYDWKCPMHILCGENDSMTALSTIRAYAERHRAELTILPHGEHWFHTPEQLAAMTAWERKNT